MLAALESEPDPRQRKPPVSPMAALRALRGAVMNLSGLLPLPIMLMVPGLEDALEALRQAAHTATTQETRDENARADDMELVAWALSHGWGVSPDWRWEATEADADIPRWWWAPVGTAYAGDGHYTDGVLAEGVPALSDELRVVLVEARRRVRVGSRIRRRLEERGVGVGTVAKEIGVHVVSLRMYLSGKNDILLPDVLAKIEAYDYGEEG